MNLDGRTFLDTHPSPHSFQSIVVIRHIFTLSSLSTNDQRRIVDSTSMTYTSTKRFCPHFQVPPRLCLNSILALPCSTSSMLEFHTCTSMFHLVYAWIPYLHFHVPPRLCLNSILALPSSTSSMLEFHTCTSKFHLVYAWIPYLHFQVPPRLCLNSINALPSSTSCMLGPAGRTLVDE